MTWNRRHDKPLAKGFVCVTCQKSHRFPGYVYAHWDDRLIMTCDCGEKYTVLAGSVTGKLPKGRRNIGVFFE